MDKQEHGARLRAAMAARNLDRRAIADAVGVGVRTVTNWTSGATLPQTEERTALRKLLPAYDEPGDAVMIAIMGSELTEDRQYAVLGYYKRQLREQLEGGRDAG